MSTSGYAMTHKTDYRRGYFRGERSMSDNEITPDGDESYREQARRIIADQRELFDALATDRESDEEDGE